MSIESMGRFVYGLDPKKREQKRQDYIKHREAYLRRANKHYLKNRQSCIDRAAIWNKANKKRRNKILLKYNNTNHSRILEMRAKTRERDRDKINEYSRLWHKAKKIEVYSFYSKGIPKCACCNIQEIEFLTIDHIEGRKKFGHKRGFSGSKLLKWIIDNHFPEGFQILCWNCNAAKGLFGNCPHRKKMEVVKS